MPSNDPDRNHSLEGHREDIRYLTRLVEIESGRVDRLADRIEYLARLVETHRVETARDFNRLDSRVETGIRLGSVFFGLVTLILGAMLVAMLG